MGHVAGLIIESVQPTRSQVRSRAGAPAAPRRCARSCWPAPPRRHCGCAWRPDARASRRCDRVRAHGAGALCGLEHGGDANSHRQRRRHGPGVAARAAGPGRRRLPAHVTQHDAGRVEAVHGRQSVPSNLPWQARIGPQVSRSPYAAVISSARRRTAGSRRIMKLPRLIARPCCRCRESATSSPRMEECHRQHRLPRRGRRPLLQRAASAGAPQARA